MSVWGVATCRAVVLHCLLLDKLVTNSLILFNDVTPEGWVRSDQELGFLNEHFQILMNHLNPQDFTASEPMLDDDADPQKILIRVVQQLEAIKKANNACPLDTHEVNYLA